MLNNVFKVTRWTLRTLKSGHFASWLCLLMHDMTTLHNFFYTNDSLEGQFNACMIVNYVNCHLVKNYWRLFYEGGGGGDDLLFVLSLHLSLSDKPSRDKLFRTLKSSTRQISQWPGNLTKEVLFHQDNALAHNDVVAMAAVRDCVFAVVDHPT